MKNINTLMLIGLVLVAGLVFGIRACNRKADSEQTESSPREEQTRDRRRDPETPGPSTRGLNRNPSLLSYSKHARCRMDCRHVSEAEVKEILKDGKVNYKKSELSGKDCDKKYAVEGTSRDNQKLRIVFAPCADEVTVVTCIDLDKEWECNCE